VRARKPLSPWRPLGSFVFLCHAPDVTLSEEQLAGARLGRVTRASSGIGSPGLASCARALAGVVSRTGAKGQHGDVVDQVPKARGSPKPWTEAAVKSGSARFLCQRMRVSVPDGLSPQSILGG
jgi:hypothetical protein